MAVFQCKHVLVGLGLLVALLSAPRPAAAQDDGSRVLISFDEQTFYDVNTWEWVDIGGNLESFFNFACAGTGAWGRIKFWAGWGPISTPGQIFLAGCSGYWVGLTLQRWTYNIQWWSNMYYGDQFAIYQQMAWGDY